MLRIEGLTKELGSFKLDNISFEVEPGDYFVLLGESGAGKTVILEMISGLLPPDAGTVRMDGKDITHDRIQSRGIGLVYQDHALFPHMSVRKNIAYPIRDKSTSVEALAEMVGATDLLDRDPTTLSLGESQRVALARTLATKPRILMLDEPLASLDIKAKAAIRSLLRRLNADGQTIIHVTHDYEEALALASKVAVLEATSICQIGTPDEVFHHPKSSFIANFVGIKNFFHGELAACEGVATFRTQGVEFTVSTDAPTGRGAVIFESKDVTLSPDEPHGSARNCFQGTIVDVEPIHLGFEVCVDIGVHLYASVTKASMDQMELRNGKPVWIGFKSTAVRYIEE
jgi:molybdate/tungstate transport system ATP-binding protein